MMNQRAVTHLPGNSKSQTSLKGKLCEGGIQYPLPFSNCPLGTLEWKEEDWEGKKAKEIETCRGERCFGGQRRVGCSSWKWMRGLAWGGSREKKKSGQSEGGFSPFHSLFLPLEQFSGYLLWARLSQWNGRGNGLLTGFPCITYRQWCL